MANHHISYKPIFEYKRLYKHLIGSVIVIDGNIGVGKSVLGRSIEKYLNSYDIPCIFFPEYFNRPLLDYYLADLKGNAFMFQAIMANSRIELYRRALLYTKLGYVSIIDRSILGDTVFAHMLRDKNHITQEQFSIYWSIISDAKDMYCPDHTIFLNCDADTCTRRVSKRNITSEINVYDKEYHETVSKTYEKIYNTYPDLNVIYIDYNTDDILTTDGFLSESYTNNILSKLM